MRADSANFVMAQLQRANLSGAQLQGAYPGYAQLDSVKNLTIEQLSKVKTLYEAELDSTLLQQIKKEYPLFWRDQNDETFQNGCCPNNPQI